LNTIHKKVVFESLYTKEDLSCSPCFLVEQWDTSTFTLDASSKSIGSKLLLLPNRDARAMQVVVLYDTRTAYFIYLLKLARLVTLFFFFNAFVSKANPLDMSRVKPAIFDFYDRRLAKVASLGIGSLDMRVC